MKGPPTSWIEKAIRINSVTHESNAEMVKFLVPLCEQAGLKVAQQRVSENGKSFINLLAFSHSLKSPDLLAFNSHLDTVTAGEGADWTKTGGNPHKATRVRNRIYGLGTADVKLDFLCKILAASRTRPLPRPICLVGTYGEERGLVGAERLFSDEQIKPKYALVGEPSNLELIYAHKGHLVVTLEVPLDPHSGSSAKKWKGKSAHSSTPELGKNALRKAMDDIFKRGLGIASLNTAGDSNKVPAYCEAEVLGTKNKTSEVLFSLLAELDDLARDLKKHRHSRFTPPRSTLSLNMANTTDTGIQLTFDCRTLPDVSLKNLQTRIEKIARQLKLKVIEITPSLPLKGNRESRIMKTASKCLKDCGVKVVKTTKASSTEAAIYQANGAQAIVFGPGVSIGNVHRPNEYNTIGQLETAVKFYENMMVSHA